MFAKFTAAVLGAGLLIATPVALAAPAPVAPTHGHGYYLCIKPHTTITVWDGKAHKQIWCKNPAPGSTGFRPLHK